MTPKKWFSTAVACWSALAAGACRGPSSTPLDDLAHLDTGTIVEPPHCHTGLRFPTFPAAGAVEVYYRTPFLVRFEAPETTTASFELLRDSDESRVPLSPPQWSETGKDATFEPARPLEPATAYTLHIRHRCTWEGPVQVRFTTSTTGAPVDPALVEGSAYALNFSTLVLLEPAGVASLLRSLLAQAADVLILRVPDDLSADTPTWFGGAGTVAAGEVVQSTCSPTFDLGSTGPFPENPFVHLTRPSGISFSLSGAPVRFASFELSGAFAPGGDRIEGVTLSGALDLRTLSAAVGPDLSLGTGEDAVCVLAGQLTAGMVTCRDCPDGTGPYCVHLTAANLVAERVTGPFNEITQQDVDTNAACSAP